MRILSIGIIATLIAFAGCDNSGAEESPKEVPAAEAPGAGPDDNEAPQPAGDPKVPADGKKHDPPLALDKVADGDWYCDMGTAHYTQKSEGSGKCPLCGMGLKKMDHAAMGHGEKGGHEHGGDDHHHE